MSRYAVPDLRIRAVNDAPIRERDFVLYWMIAARRTEHNFALQRAVGHARELGRPLVVLEALRCDYRWASARLHRFVLDGMVDNARACARVGVLYYPYVEPEPGAGRGLLAALSKRASVVITDEFPCFFLPRMVDAAARGIDVRLEAVDGNGLLPLRVAERAYPTAATFRRFLQKTLPDHLGERPLARPLARAALAPAPELPRSIPKRWPAASLELLEGDAARLAELPIDADVTPVSTAGGARAGAAALDTFVRSRIDAYGEDRNHPDERATSGLSPYLHFGHVSTHAVFEEVIEREQWSPDDLAVRPSGSRSGWWGMSAPAEGFLDELVTWREVGYNFCSQRDDYDAYDSLPDWARETLAIHASDPRETIYSLAELEASATYDGVWNAAQNELVREGRMHNYLRMLWGKKILEWSPDPRAALDVMIELNNKYALDGRNPNSYSGIFWTLGRYDRPWGPERPIFGKIRFMSSASAMRKLRMREYLETYGDGVSEPGLPFGDV